MRDAGSTCADVRSYSEEFLSVWPVRKRHSLDFGPYLAFKPRSRI